MRISLCRTLRGITRLLQLSDKDAIIRLGNKCGVLGTSRKALSRLCLMFWLPLKLRADYLMSHETRLLVTAPTCGRPCGAGYL